VQTNAAGGSSRNAAPRARQSSRGDAVFHRELNSRGDAASPSPEERRHARGHISARMVIKSNLPCATRAKARQAARPDSSPRVHPVAGERQGESLLRRPADNVQFRTRRDRRIGSGSISSLGAAGPERQSRTAFEPIALARAVRVFLRQSRIEGDGIGLTPLAMDDPKRGTPSKNSSSPDQARESGWRRLGVCVNASAASDSHQRHFADALGLGPAPASRMRSDSPPQLRKGPSRGNGPAFSRKISERDSTTSRGSAWSRRSMTKPEPEVVIRKPLRGAISPRPLRYRRAVAEKCPTELDVDGPPPRGWMSEAAREQSGRRRRTVR